MNYTTQNEHIANIQSLADGSGIGDGALGTSTLANSVWAAIGNYSTSEVETPFRWIDNKKIYKKTVSLGNGPNNNTKDVAHGITGISEILFTMGTSNGNPFPVSSALSTSLIETIRADTTIIRWRSTYDATGLTAKATIWYTKT